MLRSLCFCFALVSASVAFGQQRIQLPNGQTGTFVADGQQIAPTADPNFQQPVVVQQRQHASNCSCQTCKRTLVGKTKQVFSKTHTTVVTTEHFVDEHPVQFFNESPPACPTPQRNPCPPQNPCVQPQRQSGGLQAWNQGVLTYAEWCAQQRQRQSRNGLFPNWGGRPLVAVNAGVSVAGFGPQLNVSVGHQPPYAQAGHNYNGNYAWHGGR